MKPGWTYWIVAVVSVLWNLGGAFDYYMTRTGNPDYLAQMTAEQVAYFGDFPFVVGVFWALGVWGALLGSLLLLVRSRFAVWAFAISILGIAVNLLWGLLLAPTPMTELMGPGAAVFSAAIVAVAVLLLAYARKMEARGVLR